MTNTSLDRLSPAKRALLERRLHGGTAPAAMPVPQVTRRTDHGPAPLSATQEQLWYTSQVAPGNPVYNEVGSIRKNGSLDLEALRRAFDELVRRHEILRTTFELVDGTPVQIVHPAAERELELIDLSGLPADEREQRVSTVVAAVAKEPYDLAAGPLLRPLLFRLTPEHHRLYLAMHHLIFDGYSLYRVMLPELVALYDAYHAGRRPELAEPALQYADYAVWDRERADGPELNRRLDHWRQRLSGAPVLQLPLDHPRPAVPRFTGHMESLELPRELVERLRAIGHVRGATLFQVLTTAFTVLLHRYCGQDDIVFGTIADLRQLPELEQLVGYCLTPMVVRADVAGSPSFLDLVGRLRTELVEGLTNLVPFERLVREVHPKRAPGSNPIYQAMIVLEPPVVGTDPSWSMHQLEPEIGRRVGHAKVDFHLELDERPDGHIAGRLLLNSDVFDAAFGARAVGHFRTMLEAIAADPAQPVGTLPLLTPREQRRQLVEWNATGADTVQAGIHELVAAQARRAPSSIALQLDRDELSYEALDARADRLARGLRRVGAGPGEIVAICAERSFDMIVGLLAILKTGAAYLPLDPGLPAERLRYVIDDSGAAIVLAQEPLLGHLPEHAARTVTFDAEGFDEEPGVNRAERVPTGVRPQDLAYLLYTSGSTGRPKGVGIHHGAVVNLLTSMQREPGLGPDDRVLGITTYAFDMSVVELWLPLVVGARMVLGSRADARDGRRLAELIDRSGATFMQGTPATWQMLLDSGWQGRPGLVALCGGEQLKPQLAAALLGRVRRLWNMYGPTETTVWSTLAPVEPGAPITIGRPIANTQIYLLDRNLQPVPVGVSGEIVIGGDGVAAGYWHRPELTAERFLPQPWVSGGMMYRTGDLGRQLADGRIEHLGRLDHQVKIRGFRIEPGEIEATLAGCAEITAAVVVPKADPHGEPRLVAYLLAAGERPSPATLRDRLRRVLPDYMVPAAFVYLEEYPLTPNGKVDRAALPDPVAAPSLDEAPETFRSDLEERLAQIWAAGLGTSRVGIHDNFFELGGHSLLAVRMLVAVERELGVRVPVGALFEAGMTVAGLAAVIQARSAEQAGSPLLVPLATASATHTLFFVNPGEASALTMRHLPGPLRPDFQVTGLLPEGAGRRFDRSRTVEELAQPMLEAIRQAQPKGPYYVAGYSLGGLLAYEIAGRLRAAGEEVGWLGLLDVAPPVAAASAASVRAVIRRSLRRSLRQTVRAGATLAGQLCTEALIRLRLRPPQTNGEDYDLVGALRLTRQSTCRPNDAPLAVLVTDESVAYFKDETLGWGSLHTGPIGVHRIGGDHLSMVEQPSVDRLAETLAASLRAARDALEGPRDGESAELR